MHEELGKWLMDIAKYMITALLLSSVFINMGSVWTKISVGVSGLAILAVGLVIIKNVKKEKKS